MGRQLHPPFGEEREDLPEGKGVLALLKPSSLSFSDLMVGPFIAIVILNCHGRLSPSKLITHNQSVMSLKVRQRSFQVPSWVIFVAPWFKRVQTQSQLLLVRFGVFGMFPTSL